MTSAHLKHQNTASVLLLVLVGTFITLVPGGTGITFWGFNAFLIGLGILAIISGLGLRRQARFAPWGAIIASWGYIFVVLLDLGHVFPTTPDPIPLLLGLIEILDVILAGYVLVLCHKTLGHF
jgi:hypothetical protein